MLAALAPWAAPGCLANFLGDVAGPADVVAAYAPTTAERLREVERRLDPTGVFSYGHALTDRS